MYVLQDGKGIKPFAIVKEGKRESFEEAIKEEYALVSLEIAINEIPLSDWGGSEYFSYKGKDEFGTEIDSTIQVTKLVTY